MQYLQTFMEEMYWVIMSDVLAPECNNRLLNLQKNY